MASTFLPPLPAATADFPKYLAENKKIPIRELLRPYQNYENHIRDLFARDPANAALADNHLGLVPVYAGHEDDIEIRARDLHSESAEEKAKYIMPLTEPERKMTGEKAIVGLERFQKNFQIYSGNALVNLDWTNVVAAGSSVLLALLAIPEERQKSHKILRGYYNSVTNEQLMRQEEPYVHLFIYGLDETASIKKLEQMESTVRGNTLWDTTCVRTKDTLTIVSQTPNRPIRIRLHRYSSISQLLHSSDFGVECACVAYDGKQVYTTPRGIASWILQSNSINVSQLSLLGRYERELDNYRYRGFEVFYENLHRGSIDPSIYKFSINQLHGLARLLAYEANLSIPFMIAVGGLKRFLEKEKAEWEVSIQYCGEFPRYSGEKQEDWSAKGMEDVVYQQDLKLNEWKGEGEKNRVAYLHRHPAFVGSFEHVKGDCCGNCPIPQTVEEINLQSEDDQHYVRGDISFLEVPTNPTLETEEAWAETAYARAEDEIFHRAITELDVEAVRSLVQSWPEENLKKNVNRRGYTGKTPLQLAVLSSSPEIVDILINAGAELTARLSDGRNSLHIAAARGDPEIVKLLLLRSERNEELKMEREDRERAEKRAIRQLAKGYSGDGTESFVDVEYDDDDDDLDFVSTIHGATSVSVHTGASSFVEVTKKPGDSENDEVDDVDAMDDVLDINMPDKTYRLAPFHYAIIRDNKEVLTLLASEFGADILRQVTLYSKSRGPDGAVRSEEVNGVPPITLVRYIDQKDRREDMLRTLLKLGASSAQVDAHGVPAIVRMIQVADLDCLKIIFEEDGASALVSAESLVKYFPMYGSAETVGNALTTAICFGEEDMALFLLEKGVSPKIHAEKFKGKLKDGDLRKKHESAESWTMQPAELAIRVNLPEIFVKCIELGVNPSDYTYEACRFQHQGYPSKGGRDPEMTYLDLLRQKISDFEQRLKRMPKPAVSLPPGMIDGTYQHWIARRIVHIENERRGTKSVIRGPRGHLPRPNTYEAEKSELEGLRTRYQELVTWLLSKGAKTYHERARETESTATESMSELDNEVPNSKPYTQTEGSAHESKPEELLSEITPSYTYLGVDDKDTEAAYHRCFQAAWDGDETVLRAEFLPTDSNDVKAALKVSTQNELGDTIFSVAKHRNHPKEFLDFIREIAASQDFILENGEQTKSKPDFNPLYHVRVAPFTDYHSPDGLNIIRDEDVEALEEVIKVHGLRHIMHSGMDFREDTETETANENAKESAKTRYLGLSIDGKRREGSGRRDPTQNAMDRRPLWCPPGQDQPIALFAAYYGSLKVLEWLETDGPELALREHQRRLEEKERLKELSSRLDGDEDEELGEGVRTPEPPLVPSQIWEDEFSLRMLRRAGKETIRQWMGLDHPQLAHAVILNRLLEGNKSDREKLEWYEKVLRFLISRNGPGIIESTHNSEMVTPIFLAASIQNKWAMQVLLSLGASLHANHNGEELNIVHNILGVDGYHQRFGKQAGYPPPLEMRLKSIRDCLDILPEDFKKWAFTNKQTKSFEEVAPCLAGNGVAPIMAAITYTGAIDLNSRDSTGNLLLHTAAKSGILEVLRYLLDISTPGQILTENTSGTTISDIVDKLSYANATSSQFSSMSAAGQTSGQIEDCYPLGKFALPSRGPGLTIRGNPHEKINMVHAAWQEAVQRVGRRRILVSLSDVNKATKGRANSGPLIIRCTSPGPASFGSIVTEWARLVASF
ncbi:hypothetical protein TWF281_006904 [Arthrobotrys megalospora]